jgi:hypothetical protein
MGKVPNDYVPLKFASENQNEAGNMAFNLLMIGMTGLFAY